MPLNKIARIRNPTTRDCVRELRDLFMEHAKREPELFYDADVKLVDEMKFLMLRCLISKRKNVKEAYQMLVSMCKWRKEWRLRELTELDFPAEYFSAGISFVYEPDKFGNRTLYIRTQRLKCIAELKQSFKHFMAYLLYQIDDCVNGETFAIIFDLTNTGWNNYDIDLMMFFLNMLKEYYPANLDYVLAINFPWVLTAAWSVVKRLIPPERRDVVVFIQDKDVFNYIDKQQCPDFLEGECKREHQFLPKSGTDLVDYLILQNNPPLSPKRVGEIVKALSDLMSGEQMEHALKQVDELSAGGHR